MGLDRVDPDADPRAVDAPFALYDGSQFVMNQSDWTVLTLLRMGLRYGTAPLRFDGLPQAFFKKFYGIYDLQVDCPSSRTSPGYDQIEVDNVHFMCKVSLEAIDTSASI